MSLADLPGVAESLLPDAVLRSLPGATPPAPWRCRVEAVVWWHRASLSAADLLPPGLEPGPAVAVGAFVRYLDTPVGPYDEVLGCPHLLAGAARRGVLARVHLPFIAVDSVPSVHGGRAHWSLPKVLASFTRTEDGGVRADGDSWYVAADAHRVGPPLPAPGRLADTQVDGDGTVRTAVTRARALGHLATVEVQSSEGLAWWLRPGRHRGLVLRGRVTVGVAVREDGQASHDTLKESA